jgi:MFS transporter, ACS family, hexuronate transporter
MSQSNTIQTTVGNYRWTICGLLFFATTVNYLDRAVLSLLKPELSGTFGWTESDYGYISACFTLVYAISMVFAGRIIDKLGTKLGFHIAIALWSIGAVIHAYSIPMGEWAHNAFSLIGITVFPISVLGFMIARAVLAIGEAGNFPAAIKTTAEYFPKKERSFATGIFNSGANIGAILAPLTVPWIAVNWGWQSAFMIVGAIGFIWMIFWQIFYESPDKQKRLSKEELSYIRNNPDELVVDESTEVKTSWFKLLQYRQTWAFAFGKFMTDGVWWFYLFWSTAYLDSNYGIKGMDVTWPLTVLYTIAMVGSISGGAFPKFFINKGFTPYDARMKAMLVIAIFPLVVLLAQPFGHISYWVPILLIGIGAAAHQAWSANIFTTVSDMFPKKAVASAVGIGGMAGGIGGFLVNITAGRLFDHYKSMGEITTGYSIMFAFCAMAYLLAWGVMKLLVPKYKPITDL